MIKVALTDSTVADDDALDGLHLHWLWLALDHRKQEHNSRPIGIRSDFKFGSHLRRVSAQETKSPYREFFFVLTATTRPVTTAKAGRAAAAAAAAGGCLSSYHSDKKQQFPSLLLSLAQPNLATDKLQRNKRLLAKNLMFQAGGQSQSHDL